MPDIPTEYNPETVNQRLREWGFASEYLDNLTGKLHVEEYVDKVLKPHLSVDGERLGELKIPAELQMILVDEQERKKLNVALISAIMGFGHLRPARAMELLLSTLDIKCTHVCFGDGTPKKQAQRLEKSLQAVNVNYIRSSIAEAVEQKILNQEEGLGVIAHTKAVPDIITIILDVIHRFDSRMYHDIVSGNPSKMVDAKKTAQLLKILKFIYAKKLHKYFKANKFSQIINFYPLLNWLLADIFPTELYRMLTILTDSVVNPGGWGPVVYQIAEREEARSKIADYWGKQYRDMVIVSEGFPAPIAGLVKVQELAEKRKINLENGQPLTIYLPASQVTTTQQGAFKEILKGCRPLLETNQVRIIVQTGTGDLGRILYGALAQIVNDDGFSEMGRKNILLHWAPDSLNVIDLFEVISGSEMPLSIGVKGSEMARMAVMLNVPHIALGAIGYHEYWNIMISAIQETPIIILPKAREAVLEFIKNAAEFNEGQKKYYSEKVETVTIATEPDKSLVQIMAQVNSKSREYIKRGGTNLSNVQRDMMLKTLAFLFSGQKEVFT